VLVVYTYALFFATPYTGFEWNAVDGTVVNLWLVREPGLRLRDQIESIGDLPVSVFQADLRQAAFQGVASGQAIPIKILREGRGVTIDWTMPGMNWIEVRERIFSQWWLAWLFWIFGLLAFLMLRPRDTRWRLFSAFNCLTAVWLMASTLSRWHVWESALLQRAAIWLSVPVYWHLHWLFPEPLPRLPGWVRVGVYGIAILLATAQWFQLLPASLYGVGFLMALGGVVGLLAWRLRLPTQRVNARLVLGAALLAIAPPFAFGLLATLSNVSVASATSLLALPVLPLFYFYAAYRRQLGTLEMRANRLLAIYLFAICLALLASVLFPVIASQIEVEGETVILGIVAMVLGGLLAAFGFAPFQRLVEHRLLGIPMATSRLLEAYSQRIAASSSYSLLAALLRDEILPSLLVRQSALLLVGESSTLQPLYVAGVSTTELPAAADLPELARHAGQFWSNLGEDAPDPCPWARVILLLTANRKTIGLWLFGRRDPDDFYSQTEILQLQSMASQMAIALTSILQAEQLRQLYRADIDQREAERARLARELHDQVLNQMAVLKTSVSEEQFLRGYTDVVASLRQTVSDLRPAMLDYGLYSALSALVDDYMDQARAPHPKVALELAQSDVRFDPLIEQHLYRIVQQACGNAYQHAHAHHIVIRGRLEPARVDLTIEDDGQGFNPSLSLQISELIAHKHYGLAGMMERAALINATLTIDSNPSLGTRIQVVWNAAQ
jgi:signal transduction histidine kinase